MSYEVILLPSAERDLDDLPLEARRRIVRRLLALEDNPRPAGIVAVKGCPPRVIQEFGEKCTLSRGVGSLEAAAKRAAEGS